MIYLAIIKWRCFHACRTNLFEEPRAFDTVKYEQDVQPTNRFIILPTKKARTITVFLTRLFKNLVSGTRLPQHEYSSHRSSHIQSVAVHRGTFLSFSYVSHNSEGYPVPSYVTFSTLPSVSVSRLRSISLYRGSSVSYSDNKRATPKAPTNKAKMREHSYPFPEDDEDFESSQNLGFEIPFEPHMRRNAMYAGHSERGGDFDDSSSLGGSSSHSSTTSPKTPDFHYRRPSIRKSMTKMLHTLAQPTLLSPGSQSKKPSLMMSPKSSSSSRGKLSSFRNLSSKSKKKAAMSDEEKLFLVMKELTLLSD